MSAKLLLHYSLSSIVFIVLLIKTNSFGDFHLPIVKNLMLDGKY